MPTKVLPEKADIVHLKHQARDLLRAYRDSDPAAIQRFREFHPAATDLSEQQLISQQFTLSDAQFALAREYGIVSWRRLREIVCANLGVELDLTHHERIDDPLFRKAVDFLDEGNIDALRNLLRTHPKLVRQTVHFEGGNYFQHPTLIEFIAENPTRNETLPDNIVSVAKLILDMGAKELSDSIEYTLSLISSGRVVRECGVQIALIDLLCAYGARPETAMHPALGHGEFDAARALIRHGAPVDLVAAAALGDVDAAEQQLPLASPAERHQALATCTQHGHVDIVTLLLDAGEDPNRYNPVGYHAHSTPLHQAALAGYLEVVELLVGRGARVDMPDIHHEASASSWAKHAGHEQIVEFLKQHD